jgi:hypothetical protein
MINIYQHYLYKRSAIRNEEDMTTRKTRIDKEEILRLNKKGISYWNIGKKLGCSGNYVKQVCDPIYREKNKLCTKNRNKERYNTDPKFRKKQIKATTDYIMDKYYNCPAYRERYRENDRIRWNTKRSPIIKSKNELVDGYARKKK